MEIKRAVRRALPLQIALCGPSGSGKTCSALQMAAGLVANPKVVVIDTERGRASLYADNKRVLSVLPNGFDVLDLDAPYHPERYIQAIDTCERAGYNVCIIDSASDSWDGPGGQADIAEQNRGMWNESKRWNKRLMTRINLSGMNVICCLKAQEKTKVVEVPDERKPGRTKKEFIPIGWQPICEKNFFYPMLLGLMIDAQTHVATAIKYIEDIAPFFATPHLISKQDGENLRRWNEGGKSVEPVERLLLRAEGAAGEGTEAYRAFFESLRAEQKRLLKPHHERLKRLASEGGKAEQAEIREFDIFPDPMDFRPGERISVKGKVLVANADCSAWTAAEGA